MVGGRHSIAFLKTSSSDRCWVRLLDWPPGTTCHHDLSAWYNTTPCVPHQNQFMESVWWRRQGISECTFTSRDASQSPHVWKQGRPISLQKTNRELEAGERNQYLARSRWKRLDVGGTKIGQETGDSCLWRGTWRRVGQLGPLAPLRILHTLVVRREIFRANYIIRKK